jgi:hypothetical protein
MIQSPGFFVYKLLNKEPISKVCCCSSGESWTWAFAGVTLFNRFEIGSKE